MKDLDGKVADALNKKHEEDVRRVNKGKKEIERLKMGSVVWYRRPE